MMSHDAEQDALAVLEEIYNQLKPNAPWSLIQRTYAIERQNQFDRDRDIAISDIRRLVNQHVAEELSLEASEWHGESN